MIGDHPDRDDLVAFALGALEPGEERTVEAHVPGCARCTRELEALVPAVGVLAESVDQVEPPPELRERVLGIVRSEAAGSAESAPQRAPRRGRRGLRAFVLRPAVALVTIAVIAAGVGGYFLNDTGGGGTTTVASFAPKQPGMGGSLTVSDDTSMLDLHGMPPLSGGEVYQVWVGEGPSVQPSSTFLPEASGRAMAAVDRHLDEGTQVMITRESGPGHTTPTPPVLLTATVQ